MSEEKKISFGFTKQIKKSVILPKKPQENKVEVQLIECVEENDIKIIGFSEEEVKPLVIPLKDNQNERVQNKVINFGKKTPNSTNQQLSNLDQQAVQEILDGLKNKPTEEKKVSIVPNLENITKEGEAQSTLEDYENIPVNDFGLAMLRGMGWDETKGIGKSHKDNAINVQMPNVRPKGLGLGADKAYLVNNDKPNDTKVDLKLIKGACVQVLSGRHRQYYGEVQGFDEDNGLVIIKLTLKNEMVSLNECLIKVVSKDEFSKNSKVLNVQKYEDYKNFESKHDEVVAHEEKIDFMNDRSTSTGHKDRRSNDEIKVSLRNVSRNEWRASRIERNRDESDRSPSRSRKDRSSSRSRKERSSSKSRKEKNRDERSSSRSRKERNSSRSRKDRNRSSSRSRKERGASRSRKERSSSRSRKERNERNRSSSRSRNESSSSRIESSRKIKNRDEISSSRNRNERSRNISKSQRNYSEDRKNVRSGGGEERDRDRRRISREQLKCHYDKEYGNKSDDGRKVKKVIQVSSDDEDSTEKKSSFVSSKKKNKSSSDDDDSDDERIKKKSTKSSKKKKRKNKDDEKIKKKSSKKKKKKKSKRYSSDDSSSDDDDDYKKKKRRKKYSSD